MQHTAKVALFPSSQMLFVNGRGSGEGRRQPTRARKDKQESQAQIKHGHGQIREGDGARLFALKGLKAALFISTWQHQQKGKKPWEPRGESGHGARSGRTARMAPVVQKKEKRKNTKNMKDPLCRWTLDGSGVRRIKGVHTFHNVGSDDTPVCGLDVGEMLGERVLVKGCQRSAAFERQEEPTA